MTPQESNVTKLTQAEAQARLFEAAKTNDLDAARSALAAGADFEAENDEGECATYISYRSGSKKVHHLLMAALEEKLRGREIEQNVFVNRILVSIAAIATPFFFWDVLRPTSTPDLPPNGAAVVRDNSEAQGALRTMLQDPALADRIIKQMREPSFIDSLVTDPKIMQNLQKVATAIAKEANIEHASNLDEKRGENGSALNNWTERATQEQDKSVGSRTGRD